MPPPGAIDDPSTAVLGRSGAVALARTVAVVSGPAEGEERPLTGRELVVGSGADADLRVADDAVSKRHLALSLRGAAIRVRDLGSTNGTWVGAYRVVETLVPPGTMVQVGRTWLHLRGEGTGGELAPSARDRFGDLRGGSLAMRQLYAVLERVAPTASTVLVDGETGTGKELVARALHEESPRRRGPLVVLDCSAVAPELVESQLFGHRKGAFTGAIGDRRGVFESAGGGTVFLDELDSLPQAVQPKLLRVLESRRVVRVGDEVERPVDVRVVAASGRSPEELVERGVLRRDLYFRLAVVRLTLPALRERLEDLPALCAHLLETLGRPLPVEPGPSLERLTSYGWPGNVRELRNALERAVTLAAPDVARFEDLRLSVLAGAGPARSEARSGAPELHERLPYKEAKERVVAAWEGAWLRAAFDRCDHNLSATAREVGLTRVHLRALLRRHGLVHGDEDPG